jgi:hypothetical protein
LPANSGDFTIHGPVQEDDDVALVEGLGIFMTYGDALSFNDFFGVGEME